MFKKIITIILFLMMIGLVLSGCNNIQNDSTDVSEKSITIGTKPMSEQYIIGEMIKKLVENKTDIKVNKKFGIAGGTSNLHPAIVSGEIDLYPEYTGTGWMFVLKNELINDPDKLYNETKKAYKEEFNIIWLDKYGFNNTFTLAVNKDVAEKYNLETYSDLAKVSDKLILGAEYDFYERDDGYNALVKEYNFDFKESKEMDIGLKYKAIDSKEVDVINAFSTDGLLDKYNLKVLKDDKNFFPSYHAATIIKKTTLEKYPELKDVLNKLKQNISEKEMRKLNYKVEGEKQDPDKVAEEFLKEKGLI